MPKKFAVIDYQKCNPDRCENGICNAVIRCERKVIRQETAYTIPDPPMMCVGCGLCVKACPSGAIVLL